MIRKVDKSLILKKKFLYGIFYVIGKLYQMGYFVISNILEIIYEINFFYILLIIVIRILSFLEVIWKRYKMV